MSYGSKGFTLVELLIAIAITALAVAAVYSTFIVQQRSFISQDQVAETQVSSKIAFDMLVNDIRNAGFGYPADENPTINGVSGAITINNAGGQDGSSDTITILGGFRQIAILSADAVVGQGQISINYSGSTSFNLSNRSFLSIDGIDFAQITNCTIPQGSSDCSSGTLTLDRGINIPFQANRPVYLVEDITYQVNNGNLQRNGDTIANNIDDLQFARIPAIGVIDRIRISLLARTANEDRTLDPSTKPYVGGIALEDGNAIGAGDRFRRRIWSTEVALRNPR